MAHDPRCFVKGFGAAILTIAVATLAIAHQADPNGWTNFTEGEVGIVVPVAVKGVSTRAILDNASERTVISSALAAQANLKLGQNGSVGGWGKIVHAQLGDSTLLTVAGQNAIVQPVVLPIGAAGPPLPMILGQDALKNRVLYLDFARSSLRLLPRQHFTAPAGFTRISVNEPSPGVASRGSPANIPIVVEGNAVSASLDLGSEAPLHVSSEFAERHHLLKGRRLSAVLKRSVGGFVTSPLVMCKDVFFAGHHFTDLPAEVFNAPNETAVLGLALVKRFHLLLDMQGQVLWGAPIASDLDKPFERDRSGLGVLLVGTVLKVMFVAPRSPAELAGWRSGDEISSVDGVRAPALKGRAWKEGPPGAKRLLTLSNGAKRALTLADYF